MAVRQSGYPVGSGSQLSESEHETLSLLSTAPVGPAPVVRRVVLQYVK